jgi:hypothetical protein
MTRGAQAIERIRVAVIDKTIKLDATNNQEERVHRGVAAKFSVEVRDPGLVTIAMRKKQSGPFVETNFETLSVGQTIPAGAIFAKLVPNPGDPLTADVRFRVRTRGDFTGQPEFSG